MLISSQRITPWSHASLNKKKKKRVTLQAVKHKTKHSNSSRNQRGDLQPSPMYIHHNRTRYRPVPSSRADAAPASTTDVHPHRTLARSTWHLHTQGPCHGRRDGNKRIHTWCTQRRYCTRHTADAFHDCGSKAARIAAECRLIFSRTPPCARRASSSFSASSNFGIDSPSLYSSRLPCVSSASTPAPRASAPNMCHISPWVLCASFPPSSPPPDTNGSFARCIACHAWPLWRVFARNSRTRSASHSLRLSAGTFRSLRNATGRLVQWECVECASFTVRDLIELTVEHPCTLGLQPKSRPFVRPLSFQLVT